MPQSRLTRILIAFVALDAALAVGYVLSGHLGGDDNGPGIDAAIEHAWAQETTEYRVLAAPAWTVTGTEDDSLTIEGVAVFPCPTTTTKVDLPHPTDYADTIKSDFVKGIEAHLNVAVFSTATDAKKAAAALYTAAPELACKNTSSAKKATLNAPNTLLDADQKTRTGMYNNTTGNPLALFSTHVTVIANAVIYVDAWQDLKRNPTADPTLAQFVDDLTTKGTQALADSGITN